MPKSANYLSTMYWVRSKPLSQIIYLEVLHNFLYVLTNSLWSDILLTHIFANVRFYSLYETFQFQIVLINCQLFIIHCDLVTPISWPTLVQVMFCLLTLQSYHLTRCWLHMNESMGTIYCGIFQSTEFFLFQEMYWEAPSANVSCFVQASVRYAWCCIRSGSAFATQAAYASILRMAMMFWNKMLFRFLYEKRVHYDSYQYIDAKVCSEMCYHLQSMINANSMHTSWDVLHGSLARYVKPWVAHAPGTAGTFSPPPRISDPDMRHARAVIHAGIANYWFPLKSMAWKPFPAFPAHAQPVILRILHKAHTLVL